MSSPPSGAPSLSRGEGTGAPPTSSSSSSLGRSDGGRPPPAPSAPSTSSPPPSLNNPSTPRTATSTATSTPAAPPSQPPQPPKPHQRGRNPFESSVLNTFTLPGTEHATWRRWALEFGLLLGMALAVLGPAVGLAVMTPYISVTSGLASDLKKDADCLKVAPEACPVPLQFDYYFWNVTNAEEWLQGEQPVLKEVGPYAFKVRELRWNANFSADKSEVTFDRLYYNEAYLAEKSCPGCSLDNDKIVTVNRGYLAVLNFYGGSEMPLVLPGVPTALAGVLGAYQAGITQGGEQDEATAKFLARYQWSQCLLWEPDQASLLEYCAWIRAQNLGPGAEIDPETADRVLTLLGNPLVGEPQDNVFVQLNALKIGLLDPPETLAAALDTTIAQAAGIKSYARHLAVSLVGPGFESLALGPKLAPSSGGLIVRKTVRQWIEGWTDPFLAMVNQGPGPASEVSAAFAWPSRDAPSLALGNIPISELKGGDHPQITRLTITSGEPVQELSGDGQGRTTYKEQLPTLLRSLDGSEFALAPSPSSPVGVRVGGSVDGRIFHQKINTDPDKRSKKLRVKGENLTLFDSTFSRPLVAHPVPASIKVEEDFAMEQAWGTRFPKAGSDDAAVVHGNAGGIPAKRYSLSNSSALACDSGKGGVDRCAAPDLFAWAWNMEAVYRCPTQATLPHFLFADGTLLHENGTATNNATTRGWLSPLQASLTALAGPSMRSNVSLHSWWFASEPFTGVSVAAMKPYQLSFGVGPSAPEVTAPALWLPTPVSSSSSPSSSTPAAASMGWVPTHWVATAFVLDGKLANDLSEGLRIVRMMKLVLSNIFPGIGLWMLSNAAWQLLGTKRAKETRAAMKVAGASRAAKPELARDELDEFAALLDADAAEEGGAA